VSNVALKNNTLLELMQETVNRFIDPNIDILSIESKPINMGLQAVELSRHTVQINTLGNKAELSLVSKNATRTERRVLTRLYSQKANVPFSLTFGSEEEERSLLCIQDVDYQTDYASIDISLLQKNELKGLSHIHTSNYGLRKELSWLPMLDSVHIEKMIYERWKPQWQVAKETEKFIDVFGEYITSVEAAANTILEDIQFVLNDESSQTLIHNDLNPGNVLVHNNTDVFFIDWEEARYGSLFLDIPLRFGTLKQIEEYRELLATKSIEIPVPHFNQMYTIASRYLGLRYMTWNLTAWTSNSHAKDGLQKYLNMVAGTSLS
jgi:hypothetical protein